MGLEARYLVVAQSYMALQRSLPEMVAYVSHSRKLEVGALVCFCSMAVVGSLAVWLIFVRPYLSRPADQLFPLSTLLRRSAG